MLFLLSRSLAACTLLLEDKGKPCTINQPIRTADGDLEEKLVTNYFSSMCFMDETKIKALIHTI